MPYSSYKKAAVAALFLLTTAAFAQNASDKNDLAVLALSHYQWQIPGGAFSQVNEQIQNVFAGIGRFNVTGVDYRLDSEGIDDFIVKTREVKKNQVALPGMVRLGQEVFTEADFTRLAGSAIVVVPVVTLYTVDRLESDEYQARLEVSFNCIDIDAAGSFALFTVEASARADSGGKAVRFAADRIAPALVLELRTIPEFQLMTGIIDTRGRQVLLGFGANMGLGRGDEYTIVTDTVPSTGDVKSEETGLLVIKEVREEISVGTLIYSDGELNVEDQLREVPRIGLDTGLHMRTIFYSSTLANEIDVVALIGIRQSTSLGFMTYRPIIGIDFPFSLLGYADLPGMIINFYGGGEIVWYLYRFQFVPTAAVGISASVPLRDGEVFQLAHAGGFVELVTTYLLGRDIRVTLSLGYSGWFGLTELSGDSYFGPQIGIGGTYKY